MSAHAARPCASSSCHSRDALREHSTCRFRQAEERAQVGAAVARRSEAHRRLHASRRRREREGVEVRVVSTRHARDGRCDLRRHIRKRGRLGKIDARGRLFGSVNRDLQRAVRHFLEFGKRGRHGSAANPRGSGFVDAACNHQSERTHLLIFTAREVLLRKLRLDAFRAEHGGHIRCRREGYGWRLDGNERVLRQKQAIRFEVCGAARQHPRADGHNVGGRN